MAHTQQAKKRIRQNKRRSAINRDRISRVRTYIRRAEEAIESGDKVAAQQALREAQPEIMRGAVKDVLHKRTASRRVSRLAHRVAAL